MLMEKCLYAKIIVMYSSLHVTIGAEMEYFEEEVKHWLDPRRLPLPDVLRKLQYVWKMGRRMIVRVWKLRSGTE